MGIKLSDIVKEKPMQSDLGYLMNQFYIEEADKERRGSDGFIHPSMLASTCLKEHYYFLSGQIEMDRAKNMLLLESARYHHLRIQKHWWRMGVLFGKWHCYSCGQEFEALAPDYCNWCGQEWNLDDESFHPYREVPLKNKKWNMTGSADGILILGNKKFLGEIKTANTFVYSKITGIQLAHDIQIQAYLHMARLSEAWVLYVDRGNALYKPPYLIRKNPKIVETIDKSCAAINTALKTGVPPAYVFNKDLEYCTKRCVAVEKCKAA